MTVLLGDYPVVLLLVFFRISGILLPLPFFGIPPGSGWLLAAVSFPLTLLFCSVLPDSWTASVAALQTPGAIIHALLCEVLLGAAIGLVCGIFISAFTFAGMMASHATSLSMAEELDPDTGEASDILTHIWRMLFLLIILALDAHLMIFRIIARTFETLPVPWMGWLHSGRDLAMLGAVCFRTGVSIALPVITMSLIVSIGMALMSRFAAEFNVMFLSLPVHVVSGVFVMALTIMLGGTIFSSVAYEMLTTVARFLGW